MSEARLRESARWALAIAVGAIGVFAVPPVGAATQIGETFQPTTNCSPRTRVQSSSPGGQYAAPFAGVVTSWSFQSSSSGGDAPVKFKVARHVSGDNFTIVGESEYQSIPDLDVLNTYPVRISVQAGDVIGLYAAPASVFLCARSAPGYVVHQSAFGEEVAVGTMATFAPVADQQLGVSALLEPDADNDGFGDETQDQCPTDAAVQGTCPVPDTTITNGPKDKTKKKSATFEFTSSIPGASFECKLDDGPFQACSSPDTVKVKKGKHHFEVRATVKGQTDASPATDDWKVKKKRK